MGRQKKSTAATASTHQRDRREVAAPKTARARASAAGDDQTVDLNALICELLTACQRSGVTVQRFADDGSAVLVDVQRGGIRCVISRVPSGRDLDRVELTPREQEVARMVAKGYPNKSIAAVLDISQWTVGTYLRRIFAKLNVNSRAAMVSRLLEERLLDDSR